MPREGEKGRTMVIRGSRGVRVVAGLLLCAVLGDPCPALAGALGKALGRGSTGKVAVGRAPVARRPLGPLHTFKEPTPLERFTRRPRLDRSRGLRPDSFWARPGQGRKGTAEHVRRKYEIPHRVTRREEFVASPGTRYHERPVKGAPRGSREVILHERVPGSHVTLRERLSHHGN